MKIVIAPDSFKGSATAMEVCEAVEEGVLKVFPEAEVVKVPMSDGGEGLVHAMVKATGGRIERRTVTGPLGEPVEAFFGIMGDGKTGVIEMAAASGLPLVPEDRRDPTVTTTYGTGELIRAVLDAGCRRVIVGIGGSATNDGGAGMAQALGVKLLDKDGSEIGYGGGQLCRIERIDTSGLDPRVREAETIVACDVDNPLCGERGAAAVYGPQKGATPEMVVELDQALSYYARLIKENLGKDVKDVPGAGAAGGLGAGLMAFLDAELKPGIEIVLENLKVDEQMKGADLVITGEGKVDRQTVYGKVPQGVARVAKERGLPVVILAGTVGEDAEVVYDHGIDAIVGILPGPVGLEEAMENAREYLARAAESVARLVMIGQGLA